MRKPTLYIFFLVAALGLLLAACNGVIDDTGGDLNVAPPPANDGGEADSPPDPPPPDTSVDEGEPQQDQADPDEAAADLPPKPALGFEFGETELEATDPALVNLSSGELHLVEMFAFW